MQGWSQNNRSVAGWPGSQPTLPTSPLSVERGATHGTFGIASTIPPYTEPPAFLQRADEVQIVRRMLSDAQTSSVFITGDPGAGKSALAALVFKRLQGSTAPLQMSGGVPKTVGFERKLTPFYFVWLSINTFANLPDILVAILRGLQVETKGFLQLKPEQQIAALTQILRRPQQSALIVLDQFEQLLDTETSQGLPGRGAWGPFFEMLQSDLGESRILLTSYRSPYGPMNDDQRRFRTYLVSRVSIPEGVVFLQQRGVVGAYEELSLVWQRCAGQILALLQFCALFHLSKCTLSYLLNAPEYQSLWRGDVTLQLIDAVYHHLNPLQSLLVRVLCLFNEPVALRAIQAVITNEPRSAAMPLLEQEMEGLSRHAVVMASLSEEGQVCYEVHALIRHSLALHYLEGNDLAHGEALAARLGFQTAFNQPITEVGVDPSRAIVLALANGQALVGLYYQSVAQERCPPRAQRRSVQEVAPLLHAVRHLCFGWRWQQACDLLFAEGLDESLLNWGNWYTLINMYVMMLPPSGSLKPRDEARVSSCLGLLYAQLDEYEPAQVCYDHALAIQRALGDRQSELRTLINLGEMQRSGGRNQQARSSFEQARGVAHQQSDASAESVALHNLGLLSHSELQYPQALSYYQEALKIANRVQEGYNTGKIITNIGMLLYEQGNQVEGVALLLFALQLRQAIQDPNASSVELLLGTLEQRLGSEAYLRLRTLALNAQERTVARLFAVA